MVSRWRRAFQVSQGSVETLFKRGGKRIYDFAANLSRKLCTKFYQNLLSFITKSFWSLLSGHSVSHTRHNGENR